MKKFISLFFFSTLFFGVHAQIQITSPWSTTGNIGTADYHFLGTTDCRPIIFKTRNLERMRLSENHSRLGIGFTDPQATLHLHHQIDARPCETIIITPHEDSTNTRTLGNKLLQMTTPATGFLTHNGFAVFSNATKDVTFLQREQAKLSIEGPGGGLTIAPDGRIGIGTTSPHTKLDIVGDISVSRLWVNHTATNNWQYASCIYVDRNDCFYGDYRNRLDCACPEPCGDLGHGSHFDVKDKERLI